MKENVYEGLFILNSELYARNPDEVSGQITPFVESLGGEVLLSRLWEERRLAYPIQGYRRGTYWLTYFKLDSQKLTELTRQCQITDSILRFLFLKVDPRIVETVVEHAKEGPIRSMVSTVGTEEIIITNIDAALEEDTEKVL
ncbi:MAG: 30S ribosomal protein S6 [Planctomycetaceae bacterium]|nr:30S ribosomal protein S6 [Planctomycetaceae bacterium]